MATSEPPITWLRAFEAAGRTGSFKQAAEELKVSPSTISHQIRDLEKHLGVPLFNRSAKRISLTFEGEQYLPSLIEGFRHIREANLSLSDGGSDNKVIKIGAFPFLANEILTPNLARLEGDNRIDKVQIFTRTDIELLSAINPEERLDIIVRYHSNEQDHSGIVKRKLSDVAIVPIVPTQSEGFDAAADLLAFPLIRVIGPFEGWQRWVDQYCPDNKLPDFSLETDSFHSAALAVERGEGVCLGVMPQIKPWLDAGRVKGLTEYLLPIEDQAAFAISAAYDEGKPENDAAIEWLQELLT